MKEENGEGGGEGFVTYAIWTDLKTVIYYLHLVEEKKSIINIDYSSK